LAGQLTLKCWMPRCIRFAAAADKRLSSRAKRESVRRVVNEIKTRASQFRFSILQGNCFEPDRALPYAPFLDLLHAFLTAHAADEITRVLGPHAPELVRLLPELTPYLTDRAPATALEPPQENMTQFLRR
jgi:hypothetical protein